ncbi:Non-specific serine/threonine protein kinase [Forsythia ovata]|uniref:Non-specific serine/threonine protein kinase n=1 Tax=Forsythia ovata TaxID=205694 RepID=A0ABD1PYI0_9LAMI
MQLDDETHAEEAQENDWKQTSHPSQPNSPLEDQNPMEDTEAGGTIKTAELLASEVADNDEEGATALNESSGLVAESEHIPPSKSDATARRNHERQALCQMIGIVDPDLREQFSHAGRSSDQDRGEREVASDSDTEDCTMTTKLMLKVHLMLTRSVVTKPTRILDVMLKWMKTMKARKKIRLDSKHVIDGEETGYAYYSWSYVLLSLTKDVGKTMKRINMRQLGKLLKKLECGESLYGSPFLLLSEKVLLRK